MMLAHAAPVLVRAYPSAFDFERRHGGDRRTCSLDATAQPLDAQDVLAWGASVRDLSCKGVGLTLCFPFKAGTYLAVDLHSTRTGNHARTVLSRVVHSRDQNDGSWHIGCEFIKPLSQDELDWLA